MSYDIYTGMLKMMDDFCGSHSDVPPLQFVAQDLGYEQLDQLYLVSEIAGQGDDISKAIRLLTWVSSNIVHKGNFNNHVTGNSIALLEYSFGKNAENGINCRALSIILAECLLAVGIAARPLYLMPFSPYDMDNHVVVHAYMNKLEKWIMLDPTYNCTISDENGIFLSAWETRQALADRRAIVFSRDMNYNGKPHSVDTLTEYMAKDLFYFRCRETFGFDFEDRRGIQSVTFAPTGYDTKKGLIVHIEHWMRQTGGSEETQEWLRSAKMTVPTYADISVLESAPH